MSLRNRTLFITGASRGIGLAIALRAARDGANVIVAAKTAEPHPKLPGTIHTAARAIEEAGGRALPLVVDVREEDEVAAAVEKAVATFGGIDILVNNASAISLTGTLADTRADLRPHDDGQHARHLRLQPGLPAAPQARGEPAHPQPLAAAQHGRRAGSRRTSPTPWRSTA